MTSFLHTSYQQTIFRCNTIAKHSRYCTSPKLARQFSSIIGCITGRIDPIATIEIIMFTIGISYELNDIDLMVMIIDICNRIQYNWNFMDRITVMNHVCGTFNHGIAFAIAIGIWIEISLLFLSYASSIIFENAVSHLNTLLIIECIYTIIVM